MVAKKKTKYDQLTDRLIELQKQFRMRAETYGKMKRDAAVEIAGYVRHNQLKEVKSKDAALDFEEYKAKEYAYNECMEWLGKTVIDHQMRDK